LSSGEIPLRGNIYWADLEPVKGSEQGGFRPVFIVSNILMNKFAPIVIAIPMTSKVKEAPFNIQYSVTDYSINQSAINQLKANGHFFKVESGFILCNQSRSISKDRLIKKIGEFTNEEIVAKVSEAIIHSYGLNVCSSCETPLIPNSTHCISKACRKAHSVKCPDCKEISPLKFRYCPNCGRSLKE